MPTTISGSDGISVSGMPFLVGQVCHFAMNSAPPGFLKANGQAISRTVYARLFAVIGTTYGAGDGSTTFNLPDLRGEFVRSLDDGRGVDAGRAIGSAQSDEFRSHFHTSDISGSGVNYNGVGPNPVAQRSTGAYPTTSVGGPETRPRNVAMLACIFTGV